MVRRGLLNSVMLELKINDKEKPARQRSGEGNFRQKEQMRDRL